MQTKKEIVLTFYPMARVVREPGGSGADAMIIGSPRCDLDFGGRTGSCDVLSRYFVVGTDEETLWASAYCELIARAKVLAEEALKEASI